MVEVLVPKKISECIAEGDVCVTGDGVNLMKDFIKKECLKAKIPQTREGVIAKMLKLLNLPNESSIWEHVDVISFVGKERARAYLSKFYKPKGPAMNDSLLSNVDIDTVLEGWDKNAKDLFGVRFHHMPFQMIDFMDTKSELYHLDVPDLAKKYDYFAVVMNTHPSYKSGEHWFCLVGDLKHKGTKSDPFVLEYFNSSGNPITNYSGLFKWIEEYRHTLLRDDQVYLEILTSIPKQLQTSHTECGVWCLCYIHSRLMGKSATFFFKTGIKDANMYDYRKHLFRDADQKIPTKPCDCEA